MTLDERVAELVAKAPPLTEQERARLRQLLSLSPSQREPARSSSDVLLPGQGAAARATATTPTALPSTDIVQNSYCGSVSHNRGDHADVRPQPNQPTAPGTAA
jgi:hypothetical protein